MFLASICFQKSRNLGFTELFSIFWQKKCEFGGNNIFDDFEVFLRLYVFEKSEKFVNDCREIKTMKKDSTFVKSHFFHKKLFFVKKNSKTGPQILKFSIF